jgi:signal transduction histidine kinase
MTEILTLAAAAALVGGLSVIGVLHRVRHRSGSLLIVGTVAVATTSITVGLVVGAATMQIPAHAATIIVGIVLVSSLLAGGCAYMVGRDMERRISAKTAELSRLEAEQAAEASRRQLIAWMSHDLRTPIAGIRAMAEALEDGVVAEPADLARYHRAIGEESNRLAGMVESIFALVRLHTDGISAQRTRAQLGDLIAHALPSVRALAAKFDIDIASGPHGAVLEVDPAAFDRFLRNLLTNAIHHTRPGGCVSVTSDVAGDGTATIHVDDECGGIPIDDLDCIFNVGFQGDPARAKRWDRGTGGAGLGLAIARGVITAHGGTLRVSNTERGCRFTATLPASSQNQLVGSASRVH